MDPMPPSPFGIIPYYAGSEHCHPLHAWGGMRDHWFFHLVHQGKGTVQQGGKLRVLHAGQGFLAPPDTEIHYRADQLKPWSYSWIACAGPVAKNCFAACGLGPGYWVYQSNQPTFRDDGGRFMQLIGQLAASRTELGRVAWLFQVFAELQAAAIGHSDLPPPSQPHRPLDAYWEAVQDFIRTTYSRDDARIENLANRIGVSRKYLSAIIRERCGQSPRALLSSYRLRQACRLLTDTALSIGAIAASVGFTDQLGFSRAFHRAYGMSPSQWRKAGNHPQDGRL